MTNLQTFTLARFTKASADLDCLTVNRDNIQLKLNQNNNILKLKESENVRLLKENGVHMKNRESLQKKLLTLEIVKGDLTQDVIKLK